MECLWNHRYILEHDVRWVEETAEAGEEVWAGQVLKTRLRLFLAKSR